MFALVGFCDLPIVLWLSYPLFAPLVIQNLLCLKFISPMSLSKSYLAGVDLAFE